MRSTDYRSLLAHTPISFLRIWVYVVLRVCMLKRSRTSNLGETVRRVPSSQSGRLRAHHTSSAKGYLKHSLSTQIPRNTVNKASSVIHRTILNWGEPRHGWGVVPRTNRFVSVAQIETI